MTSTGVALAHRNKLAWEREMLETVAFVFTITLELAVFGALHWWLSGQYRADEYLMQ